MDLRSGRTTGGGNFRGLFPTGTPRPPVTPDPEIFLDVMGEGTPTNGTGATGGTSPLTALRRAAEQVDQLRDSTASAPTTITDTPRMPQRPIYAAAGRGRGGVTFTSNSSNDIFSSNLRMPNMTSVQSSNVSNGNNGSNNSLPQPNMSNVIRLVSYNQAQSAIQWWMLFCQWMNFYKMTDEQAIAAFPFYLDNGVLLKYNRS